MYMVKSQKLIMSKETQKIFKKKKEIKDKNKKKEKKKKTNGVLKKDRILKCVKCHWKEMTTSKINW